MSMNLDDIDDATKQQLKEFMEIEQAKDQMHTACLSMTDKCWTKCIDTPGSQLSSKETSCLKNCVERFLDTTVLCYRLEEMKHQ
eukprot:Awhi_evm1s13758